MTNRSEMISLLGSEIEKADRLAGIDERVLANEILDFSFRFVVERVIGGAHVREFCLSTVSRDGSSRQQGITGCDRAEGAVGVPQPVAEFEQPDSIIRRHHRAASRQVGKIGNPTAETFLSALSNMARRFVALNIAELLGEDDLLLVRQRLVAE